MLHKLEIHLATRYFCSHNEYMAGRPKKAPGLTRTNVLRIRLTGEERRELDQAGIISGLDTSTWARYELLSLAKKLRLKRPVPLDPQGEMK
jgi:hypothetical protein